MTSPAGIQAISASQGIAVADFNADGWDDFYVTMAGVNNQLYKNLGNGTFVEIGKSAGVDVGANTTTAVWGDIDNDGFPDLYVARRQAPDLLLRNRGDETFEDITWSAGIFQVGYPFSVNMADIDNDGFLDIYISNFLYENILYRNNGDGSFTNFTYQAKALDAGKSMGTIFFDFDLDGDQDLYLVHDGNEPNFLYQNNGAGVFSEIGQAAGVNTKSFGMGVDAADIDNDGFADLYITNLYDNILLHNNGDGTFSDISALAGVQDYGMGWGTTFLDFNNDGLQDIYVANEYAFSPYPNVLYRNMGNLAFAKTETGSPVCNQFASYGTATLDFNHDGAADLLVANRNPGERLQLFQNNRPAGNWIGFKLTGIESNRDAIGARIRLIDHLGVVHQKEISAGMGWQSQNSSLLLFGLGPADSLREMSIYWPSGLIQPVLPPATGQYYRITEGKAPLPGLLPEPVTSVKNAAARPWDVFPNPVQNGILHVRTADPIEAHLEVFDLNGRMLHEQDIAPAAHHFELNLAGFLPAGYCGWLALRLTHAHGAFSQLLRVNN